MSDQQYQAPLGEPAQPVQQAQNPAHPAPEQAPAQAPVPAETKRPEDTVRDGNIKGTIWRREGKNYDFFATDFAKTYKDKSGNLRDTHSFNKDDLLRVAEVARRAHSRVTALSREEFLQKQRSAPAPQRDR